VIYITNLKKYTLDHLLKSENIRGLFELTYFLVYKVIYANE